MNYFRYYIIMAILIFTICPVSSTSNNVSFTTSSFDIEDTYSVSGNFFSNVQNEAINASNICVVIQKDSMKEIKKCDDYGNYEFGDLNYGNYSLIAFKYVPFQGRYLFGTTNVSLNNKADVADTKITLDWASEDEEKKIENFLPLLKYSLSGSIFSNVQNGTINVSDTNVIIKGNGITGLRKCDDYGNYKFGDLDNYSGLEYGNYSLTAFNYIPSQGKYLFGTTNVSLKNEEEVSDIKITLDWASEDEKKEIENFFFLFRYSLSGNVFSNVQNETINVSDTNVIIKGNGITGLRKCDDYGNYKFGDLDIQSGLEYGNYTLTAFKYVPSQGKYLFGTTNVSLKNEEEVSDIKITLYWANEDEEKIIESFFPTIRYTISGSVFSNIENGSINISDTNIGIKSNGITGLTKSDKYGNYKFGNLSIDYWLEYGNYSLTAFKYVPSQGKYLFGTTNVSLWNIENFSNVNITLDWASEDEKKEIENFLPLLRYSLSGSVFSNVQNNMNISDTNVIIKGNGMTGLRKCDEHGNYKFGDLDNYSGLEYGNYSLTAFKYIPSQGRYLFGTTNVSLNNKADVADTKITLDWASEDEKKEIENFFFLFRYSLSGSVFSNVQNNMNISDTNVIIKGNGMTGLRKCDEHGNYKFGDLDNYSGLEYGNYSLTAFNYIPSQGKYLFGTTSVSLKNEEKVSDIKIILDWANGDEEKEIENFFPLLRYSLSGRILDRSSSDSNITDSSNSDSSSGSSHSSSGGGGSPEPQSNVEIKELSQAYVTNGKPVRFDFPKKATCVMYLSFDAKKTFGKTITIAEQLKGKSTLVSGLPSGEIYKSFNIWVGNGGIVTSKNVENPVVCFKVEKAWIKDKNINPDSITLNRYDKKWEQFPINLSEEDDKFLYFTAKTSGFSSFVLAGTAISSSEETVKKIEVNYPETINKNNTTNKKTQNEQKKIPSTPSFGICYGIASLFAVLLYKRK